MRNDSTHRNKDGRRFDKKNSSENRSTNDSQESRPPRIERSKTFDKKSAKNSKEGREYISKKTDSVKPIYSKKKQLEYKLRNMDSEEEMRLNRYIANSGLCSRREADRVIADGRVTVNGDKCDTVGTKVSFRDNVCVDDKAINPEKKVYILLNKPKNCVTTSDDPQGRITVMDIVKNACKERIFPVGRLDRMTTGVLLFTNDGDLTKKLTHPSYMKKKIYHAILDKKITQEELDKIADGIELEDGPVKSDQIEFVGGKQDEVGIEIHSGKNRIVRRIFEHLGYEVVKLDRVFFGGLTKKNLPRGKWRFLAEEEVRILKTY